MAALLLALPAAALAQPPRAAWHDYPDYDRAVSELHALALRYPKLILVRSLGQSVEGRQILMATIGSSKAPKQNGEVLFDGAMHGSEVIGARAMLDYARFLTTRYGRDRDATEIVDGWTTCIVPMVNPDGVEAGKSASVWKFARRNANGVNLNRNFDWKRENAGSTDRDKEDYAGPQAFSEPESAILRDLFAAHRFLVYVNGHAGENRDPHMIVPRTPLDPEIYKEITRCIGELAGFGAVEGTLAGGAAGWAYFRGMQPLRAEGARPIAIILEMYSRKQVPPSSPAWWTRYNPERKGMRDTVGRVRRTLIYLTRYSARLAPPTN